MYNTKVVPLENIRSQDSNNILHGIRVICKVKLTIMGYVLTLQPKRKCHDYFWSLKNTQPHLIKSHELEKIETLQQSTGMGEGEFI